MGPCYWELKDRLPPVRIERTNEIQGSHSPPRSDGAALQENWFSCSAKLGNQCRFR